MVSLLIAIEPPEEVSQIVLANREELRSSVRLYGDNHAPHITLFVNTFDSLNYVENELTKLTQETSSFFLNASGIDYFEKDPVWNSFVLKYTVQKTPYLQHLIERVHESFLPLRNKDQEKWVFHQNPLIAGDERERLQKYGWPFGPENWKFHLTVGSTPEEDFLSLSSLPKNNFSWNVNHISLYTLENDSWVLYKQFPFKE